VVSLVLLRTNGRAYRGWRSLRGYASTASGAVSPGRLTHNASVQHQSAATGPATTVPSEVDSIDLLAGTTLNDPTARSPHRGRRLAMSPMGRSLERFAGTHGKRR